MYQSGVQTPKHNNKNYWLTLAAEQRHDTCTKVFHSELEHLSIYPQDTSKHEM